MMLRKLFSLVGIVWFCTLAAFGQQTTRYIYDDNGRLKAVIAPSGEVAVYSYDPAGNLTGIQRIPANITTNLDFTPKSGAETDPVEIVGTGFATTTTGNLVTFNGTNARVLEASTTRLLVEVPAGATTGPINVISPNGASQSSVPFTVIPRLHLIPTNIVVLPGAQVQFSAIPLSLPSGTTFTWAVNGIAGGDATVGTISASGLYQAPATNRTGLVVRATSASQPPVFAEAQVEVSDLGRYAFAAVSVQRGTPSPLAYLGRPVSVFFAQPYIASANSSTLQAGTATSLTLTGQNFTGVTALRFWFSALQADNAITISNLQVNADGTQLTATVTVPAGASLGNRFMILTSPAGMPAAADYGGNVIQIVP